MKKRIDRWLNLIWAKHFKTEPYSGLPAYRCRACEGWLRGVYCKDYEYPCEQTKIVLKRKGKSNLLLDTLDRIKIYLITH